MPISEAQTEALQLRESGMTKKQIAAHLGISFDAVKDRLQRAKKWQSVTPGQAAAMEVSGLDVLNARHGWRVVQHENGSRDSVFWKADEAEEQGAFLDAIREAFDGLSPAQVIPAPTYSDADLLTIYPIADAHIGMRAWSRETGESYDTDIAVARLRSWIGRLVASSPQSKEAIILDVGDTTHMDDGTNQTPASKHVLDVDGRYFRTLEMTIAAMADATELALAKHDRVQIVIIAGNHNPHSYMAILFALSERYRDNPRVTVRKDPREFWAYRFGDCLLAAHHGDKAKPERLVMFLADEYAEEWGGTKHRYLWTGHLHHHRSADIGGVKWEQLRALTARDAYAYTHAYSARAQLQAITLHRTAGEIQRQAVSSYLTE